jgi:hypothetical protein
MFKVIKDFVAAPGQFLVLCDRACGTFAWVPIAPFGLSEDAQQATWAGVLIDKGWKITLAEHVCPAHAQAEKVSPTAANATITVVDFGTPENDWKN